MAITSSNPTNSYSVKLIVLRFCLTDLDYNETLPIGIVSPLWIFLFGWTEIMNQPTTSPHVYCHPLGWRVFMGLPPGIWLPVLAYFSNKYWVPPIWLWGMNRLLKIWPGPSGEEEKLVIHFVKVLFPIIVNKLCVITNVKHVLYRGGSSATIVSYFSDLMILKCSHSWKWPHWPMIIHLSPSPNIHGFWLGWQWAGPPYHTFSLTCW